MDRGRFRLRNLPKNASPVRERSCVAGSGWIGIIFSLVVLVAHKNIMLIQGLAKYRQLEIHSNQKNPREQVCRLVQQVRGQDDDFYAQKNNNSSGQRRAQ